MVRSASPSSSSDGRSLRARVVGSDAATDIALLKVDSPAPLPAAPLGDSSTLRVGEWVCAIGNPLAYEHTVTVGVVSYLGRKLFDASLDDYIQTDAAINFGNSGGPLINARGEVIGINAAISWRASSIGFAIPINQASAILPQLKSRGRVSRGYLGITLRDLDPDLGQSLGLTGVSGALVQDVSAGSPGERAGLHVYDVIVSVDGEDVRTNDDLIRRIAARPPGSTVKLRLLRDNREQAWRCGSGSGRSEEGSARRRHGPAAKPGPTPAARGAAGRLGARGGPHGRPAAAAAGRGGRRARDVRGSPDQRVRGRPGPRRHHPRGEPAAGANGRGLHAPDERRLAGAGARRLLLRARPRPARAARRPRGGRAAMTARILVIDDEAAIREAMRMILEYEGYECVLAASGPEGLAAIERETPDLVFLDIRMPGMDGLEVLDRIQAITRCLPVVIVSGHGTVATAVEATKRGAFDFIEKPLESERVLVTVRNAIDRARLVTENRALKRAESAKYEMVGQSPALIRVTEAIRRAAPTNATVLLLGESGVGQGTRRPRHPPQQPAQPRAVRAGQLRGHPGGADRVGAVRAREGLLHGRHREADRQVRAGRPRHDLPGRSRAT